MRYSLDRLYPPSRSQVVRLETDLSVRRNELRRLCSALDALLLSDVIPSKPRQNPVGLHPGVAKEASFFDHPSVAAAAKHSASREQSSALHSIDSAAPGLDAFPLDVARTLELENEVRDLERQVREIRQHSRPHSQPADQGSL